MNVRVRLRRVFRRLNVRMFVTIASVVLLFQLVSSLFLMNFSIRQYEAQTQDLGANTLKNAEYTISSALKRMEDAAYSLSYNDTVQKYLNISSTQSDYYVVTVQKELTALMRIVSVQCLPGVHYTLYATGNKKGIATTIDNSVYVNYGYDYLSEPWYRYFDENPNSRKLFLANQSIRNFVSPITEPQHLFVYRIHRSSTLAPNGFLVLQFDQTTFDELIGELPSAIQNVLIVDGDGNTLYENMSFLTRERLMKDAEERKIEIRSENGYRYVPMAQTIGNLGWEIVCTVDASAVAENIRAFRNICVYSMVFSVVALLFLIYGISRRITRPVARLSAGMENIRLGLYDISLPVERDDEIGLLTESFNRMAHQLLDANRRLKRYEALQQSISFYALQQQVNPHFLYNTLDMIIGMATEGSMDKVIKVCGCLASMFRYNLSRELTVPLEREISHAKNFITILNHRNSGRIDIEFQIDDAARALYIPRLVLQPLIENCVKHGGRNRQDGLRIAVRAESDASDMLRIGIEDDGAGFQPDQLLALNVAFTKKAAEVPADHIGILNIYARLRLIYSEGLSMEVGNGECGGAFVHLVFPTTVPISLV